MSIPYVSRVKGAIKGAKFDQELGPKTLILGPNGIGKSRITDGIAWACQSGFPNVFGREAVAQRQKVALLGYAGKPPKADVTVEGASRATVSFGLEVRDLLRGDATKLRAWAIQSALGRDFDDELSKASARVRKAQAAVREAENAAKLSQKAVEPPMAAAERQVLEQKARTLQQVLGALRDWESVEALEQAKSEAVEAVQRAEGSMQEADRWYKLKALSVVVETHLARDKDTCLVCGNALDHERLERLAAKLADLEDPGDAVDPERAKQRLQNLRKLQLAALEVANQYGSLQAARNALEEASQALSQDRAKATAWAQMRQATKADAAEAGAALGEAQAVLTALKAEIAGAAEQAAKVLSERASTYLPEGVSLVLDLEVGVVGLKVEGDDFVRWGLSASQEQQALAALVGAALPKDDDAANVFVPHDCSWDPDTLAETLDAWTDLPLQIVVTTTTEPGYVLDGWTVVRLG